MRKCAITYAKDFEKEVYIYSTNQVQEILSKNEKSKLWIKLLQVTNTDFKKHLMTKYEETNSRECTIIMRH